MAFSKESSSAPLEFEIVEHIGVLSESARGWTTELNKVSWNKKEPRYDIRSWDSEHRRMGKGITLSELELERLYQLMYQRFNVASEM